MAARITLRPGPPTIDHVSQWLDLASNALYGRSADDLEELVVQLEQARLDLIQRETRSPEPLAAETYDDLIDEDPDDDEEEEEDEPFQSHRRVVRDPPVLYLRLATIRTTGRW